MLSGVWLVYCVEKAARGAVSVESMVGDEIERLVSALSMLEVSGDCKVEVSTVSRGDCLTIGVVV